LRRNMRKAKRFMGRFFSRWRMYWGHEPAAWHRLRGAGVFVAPPEVSAIAATSGYCLPTLRVEESGAPILRVEEGGGLVLRVEEGGGPVLRVEEGGGPVLRVEERRGGARSFLQTCARVLSLFSLLGFALPMSAQYTAPLPPAPFAGFINEWLRA